MNMQASASETQARKAWSDPEKPLWMADPARRSQSNLCRFQTFVEAATGRSFTGYDDLHRWSVEACDVFWSLLWAFCDVVGEQGEVRLLDDPVMRRVRFLPEARVNFAENLLRRHGAEDAIVFCAEDRRSHRVSCDELRSTVARLQQFLRARGVGPGDRIAGMMANTPDTVAIMLAVTSLGAIWSSCSPDFGVQGVLDRFGQIRPKLFFAVDGYWYNGKQIELGERLGEIVRGLGDTDGFVIVDLIGRADEIAAGLPDCVTLADAMRDLSPAELSFVRLSFDHPLYILFSSGTTGVPKCIVHRAGGVLLQHLKEHRLHSEIAAGDRVFYFTTCGWMMWNWLVSALASGATLLLYDGSPFHDDGRTLFRFVAQERATFFGTSAKFIDALAKADVEPGREQDLSSLRTIASTGSPLSPAGFDYVYRHISSDVHLASIAGGTDIVSCFVLGAPTEPVWRGEIQKAGLGMAVDVLDEAGRPVAEGQGELACTRAFPSMPLGFWNDPGEAKYRAAYFERFDNAWCHGDFVSRTRHGGFVIHGRSDATLNPGGVRIGTAEIYNQVELFDEIQEALCIAQKWDGDVRIVLFVCMRPGIELGEALRDRIRGRIRVNASPRHVPTRIVAVADMPRTKSGKLVELAVRDIVHGLEVRNREAIANPEALDLFRDLPELRS